MVAKMTGDNPPVGQDTPYHPLLIVSVKNITQDALDQIVIWDTPI